VWRRKGAATALVVSARPRRHAGMHPVGLGGHRCARGGGVGVYEVDGGKPALHTDQVITSDFGVQYGSEPAFRNVIPSRLTLSTVCPSFLSWSTLWRACRDGGYRGLQGVGGGYGGSQGLWGGGAEGGFGGMQGIPRGVAWGCRAPQGGTEGRLSRGCDARGWGGGGEQQQGRSWRRPAQRFSCRPAGRCPSVARS
jgi:hypothetical protein